MKLTNPPFLTSILFLIINTTVFCQVNFSSSSLPIIVINTDTNEIVDDYRIVANMGIIHNPDNEINYLTDSFNDYDGKINIELRGSTSQSFPKKPYGFETQDETGDALNVSLLGLPEENDWILHNPYSDKTLIRNVLAYELSSRLGHYAPRTKLCELVVNDDYKGIYILIEKIKRDKNRLNISKLKETEITGDDLTGGYIIKIDKSTGDYGEKWKSEQGDISFQYEYPKHDEIADEQKEYIKNYIDDFESALVSNNFSDSLEGYAKYININSFIDYFIINEISKDIDAYRLSTFFHKDKESKNGKITIGPVWDYNLAFGNADYSISHLTEGFIVDVDIEDEHKTPWWWNRLLEDPNFKQQINNRWGEIRQESFSDQQITQLIDSLYTILEIPQEQNFERWNIIGKKVWPNYFIGDTYGEEVDFLRNWILERVTWMDNTFNCSIQFHSEIGFKELSFYPNPVSESFSCSFLLQNSGIVSLSLLNIQGEKISKLIDKKTLSQDSYSHVYEISNIPNGVYFITLDVDGKTIEREKLLKIY